MAKKKVKESLPDDMPAMAKMDDYEHKANLETIMKAHEIMEDPEKMKHVNKIAGRHAKILSGLSGEGESEDSEHKPVKSIKEMKARGQSKFGKPGSNM